MNDTREGNFPLYVCVCDTEKIITQRAHLTLSTASKAAFSTSKAFAYGNIEIRNIFFFSHAKYLFGFFRHSRRFQREATKWEKTRHKKKV
jgi:hypothetical protein